MITNGDPDLSLEEQRLFYDRAHATYGFHTPPEYNDTMLDWCKAVAPGRLIDIACGHGLLIERAAERGLSVEGFDLSQVAVDKARDRCPEARLWASSIEDWEPEPGAYDHFTCLGSAEHFLDLGGALDKMERCLKSSGFGLLYLPIEIPGRVMNHEQIYERFATEEEWTEILGRHFTIVDYHYYAPFEHGAWTVARRNRARPDS